MFELEQNVDSTINLLPYDGIVNYYGKIMQQQQADAYLQKLLHTITWKNDEVIMYGRRIITARQTAWYGDSACYYKYAGITRKALPWTTELLYIKQLVERTIAVEFNSCLLNLYHNGEQGMSWHSDDEKELEQNYAIASFSLGAERKFMLKHREQKNNVSILLQQGSLLVMKGQTQKNWQHCMPKTKKVKDPRINLTFRKIII